MLLRILSHLAEGKASSIAILANEMGISEKLVSQMLSALEQLNYIKTVNNSCNGGSCRGCSLQHLSNAVNGQRIPMWVLTEKGKQAARDIIYNDE